MNCVKTQELLSARMDGEHLSGTQRAAVEAHVPGCPDCRAFVEGSARVRTAVRIRPAAPVPDLTEPIMARVAREAATVRPRATRSRAPRWRALTPAVAAAVVGVIVGSVIVGGPWQRPSTRLTSIAAVAGEIRSAAPTIDSFDGTYAIHERGLTSDVPARELQMRIAYLAPQRFRLDVTDDTAYPSTAWTPTDLTYIEDMPATYRSGPTGCPGDLPSGVCPTTRTTITRATPYSAAAPLPTDLVAPVSTFSSTDGIRVLGEQTTGGRDTVEVEMSFARAAPLFPFLRLGGTWRPFFERDRVLAWFDTSGWFPVRYQVFPANGADRRAWESRFGLPHEPSDEAILEVELTGLAPAAPPPLLFAIPAAGPPEVVPPDHVVDRLGYVPIEPTDAAGLSLVSIVAPPAGSATGGSVLFYSAGLDYLRIGEDPSWTGPGPFGPLSTAAATIRLSDGGVGVYEPAADGIGRRVAIHGATTDLYLESNLPRDELIAVASSLPVHGEPIPAWRGAT